MSDSSDENPWRETVRDIYDEMHLGQDSIFTGNPLAQRLIEIIESRHPEFFGASATKETP